MNSFKLSPRLEAIATLASGAVTAVDVGTDHGYLAVFLTARGVKVYATDLNSGPLRRAMRTADEYLMRDKIAFMLCDGLDFEDAQSCDTVIIAGMGGETIISILERAPWTKIGVRLILQPQTKQDELCEWLAENGYRVDNAVLAEESRRLYMILCASGGEMPPEQRCAEDILFEARDPRLNAWLAVRLRKLREAEFGMRKSQGDYGAELSELETLIKKLAELEEETRKW